MSSKKKKKVEKPKPTNQETSSDMPDTPEDMGAKFEQELVWCIEQLQLGLETQNPSSRQAAEATRALKILLSAKAPMIKKRQVMRNTFGDYRKKMAEMAHKSSSAARKGTIAPAVTKTMQKSTFFKKSVTRNSESVRGVPSEGDGIMLENQSTICCENSVTQSSDSAGCKDLCSKFQFNFEIKDHSVSENETQSANISQECMTIDQVCEEKTQTNVPFQKSDNSFRFSFTVPS